MPGRAAALAEALPQAGRGQAQRADLTVRGLVGGGFWGLGEVWAGEKGGGGGGWGKFWGGFGLEFSRFAPHVKVGTLWVSSCADAGSILAPRLQPSCGRNWGRQARPLRRFPGAYL